MTRKLVVFCAAALLTLAAGAAMADSIQGRLGVTGRIGFIVPADGEAVGTGVAVSRNSDVGFIGGGGFIYGVTDNIAAELDITHAGFGSDFPGGRVDFDTTNVTLGVQYRFLNMVPVRRLVPYGGGGIDILLNGADNGLGVDDVVGVHLNAGVDYFIQRQLAVTAEVKGILAPDADITFPGFGKVGDFDPSSFSTTFGVRYFFN